MAPLRILIVGCSVAGPTLASFLLMSQLPADQKPHITLLERSPVPRQHGQNVDVRSVGVALIRKLGLEAPIREATTGEKGVQWVTDNGRVWSSFAAASDEKGHHPTSDIEIMRGRLSSILLKNSQAQSAKVESQGGAGIEYIFGDTVCEIEQDGGGGGGGANVVLVTFTKSRETRAFDLVVGADGFGSQTRRTVWGEAGEADRVHHLGVYGAFFSIPRGDTDTLWRRCFHTHGRRLLMVRPHEDGERTSVLLRVINAKDPRLAAYATEGVEAQKGLLQEYFLDAGWESGRVVQDMMATPDFYYEVLGQVKMDKWSKGRVVLVGDAAHCASSISGMGTTLAMYGAYHLAGALACHPDDVDAALAAYEEKTRPLVAGAQKVMPGVFRILCPESKWGVWLVDSLIRFLVWSRVISLLFFLKKPKDGPETLQDYGFEV